MCYISSDEKKDIFDALADELDITVSHYSIGQIKSLVAFVSREKTIQNQNFLVIDLTGTDFSDEHIISAVQTLRCLSSARPVFIVPRSSKTEELFGRLINFHVTNLIFLEPGTDAVKDMRRCLSDEGMVLTEKTAEVQNSRAAAANSVVRPLKIPEGLSITFCVCGCMPRIGTTTQVFAMHYYLKSLGFFSAVLCRDDGFIKQLMELYGDRVIEFEGYITVNDIPFCLQEDKAVWNAYIIDGGILDEHSRQDFADADISVLVGGAKPWELALFAESLRLAGDAKRMAAFMSFTTQKDVEELHKVLNIPLYSVPYHPDIWDKGGGTAVYKAAVLPFITELCAR